MKPIIINFEDQQEENENKKQNKSNTDLSSENTKKISELHQSIKEKTLSDISIVSSNDTKNNKENTTQQKKNLIIEKIKENPSINIKDEDINLDELQILKQLEKVKKQKKLKKLAILIWSIILLIFSLGGMYYYRIEIANILFPPQNLKYHAQQTIKKVEIKLKELWLIESSQIKKWTLAEKYYPIYKDDFMLIYSSPLSKEKKKRLLIKLNLIMYKIIKEEEDYFTLKLLFDKFEIKVLNHLKNINK